MTRHEIILRISLTNTFRLMIVICSYLYGYINDIYLPGSNSVIQSLSPNDDHIKQGPGYLDLSLDH